MSSKDIIRPILATPLLLIFLFCGSVCLAGQKPVTSTKSQSSAAASQSAEEQSQDPNSSPPTQLQTDDRIPFMVSQENGSGAEQPGGLGLLVRTLGALLLVIGLLVASVWVLRKLKGTGLGGIRDDANLTVLSTVSIGDRRALTVVRFGERLLLLGSTQHSVTLLASEDSEESFYSDQGSGPRSVADVLNTHQASTEKVQSPDVSFARLLKRQEGWTGDESSSRERNAGEKWA